MNNNSLSDSCKKKQDGKRKIKRNDIIALIIIIPVLIAFFCGKFIKMAGSFKGLLKSGTFFETDFLLMCALVFLLTLIICLIFRRKEKDKAQLFKDALTAAVGIVMIAMCIAMCIKTI